MASRPTPSSRLQGRFEIHVALSTLTASRQWTCVHTYELRDSGCSAIACCSLVHANEGNDEGQGPAASVAAASPSSKPNAQMTDAETVAGVPSPSTDPCQLAASEATGAEAAIPANSTADSCIFSDTSDSCIFWVSSDTKQCRSPHTVVVPLRASASITIGW